MKNVSLLKRSTLARPKTIAKACKLIILSFFTLLSAQSVQADLLFKETFDTQANWQSSERCSYIGDPSCALIPQGWDFLYQGEDWNAPAYEPVGQISNKAFRGSGGKALIFTDESQGTGSRWGSDLQLAKMFDKDRFELYAEYWIKFQPNYQTKGGPKGDTLTGWGAKMFRIQHSEVITDRLENSVFNTSKYSKLVFFFDLKEDRVLHSLRCNPTYKCGTYDTGRHFDYPNGGSFDKTLNDNQWHKFAWHIKINSAPGVPDGETHFWLDGKLVSSVTDTPFIMAGGEYVGINFISFAGNQNNVWAPESQKAEQWYAIDDIAIYDTVPGGVASVPPKDDVAASPPIPPVIVGN